MYTGRTIFNHCGGGGGKDIGGGKPMGYCFRKGRRINHRAQRNIDPPPRLLVSSKVRGSTPPGHAECNKT